MNKFWDTIIDFSNKSWNATIEFLAKINSWIPLAAVLIAGVGLVSIVLILAICGCALRKRLVPHWLIWIYFIFATIIIFAHTGNDLATMVAAMEIPVLVVLFCYLLKILFNRRPHYVYVKQEVYARELAKGRVVKAETINKNVADNRDKASREIKITNKTEKEKLDRENDTKVVHEVALRETAKSVDKNDFLTVETTKVNQPEVTDTATINLPVVEPIPDKTYEPVREPAITTTPVSERIPDLKIPSTTSSQVATQRNSVTTTTTSRPTTTTTVTPSRTVTTTETTTKPVNAYTAMYNPRIVKTTTTTTTSNTDTNTNTLEAISTSHTINGNTTSTTAIKASSTNNGTTTPRSTEDIMAAIERLRASMKK